MEIQCEQKGTGGPERTRTSDLRFRKPLLYPAELRDHCVDVIVLRVAVNAPTSSLRQHARNSIVGISGVKPPQALVILAFCAAHGGARRVSGNASALLEPEHGNERRKRRSELAQTLCSPIADALRARIARAVSAAIDAATCFNTMPHYAAFTVRAAGCHGVNRTFETVERHGFAPLRDSKRLVVFVSADVAGSHDETPRLMERPIWISGHVRMDARWTVTSMATRRHRSKFH